MDRLKFPYPRPFRRLGWTASHLITLLALTALVASFGSASTQPALPASPFQSDENPHGPIGSAILQRILSGKQVKLEWDSRLTFSQDRECGTCNSSDTSHIPYQPPKYYDVPCSFSGVPVNNTYGSHAVIDDFTPYGGTDVYVSPKVLSSNPSDENSDYVVIDPRTGQIRRGNNGPDVDTVQVISYNIYHNGHIVNREPIVITYYIRSCRLRISGPDQVTIYACCFYDDYSALRMTVTTPNAPAVVWDLPSNSAAPQADGLGMPDPPRTGYEGGGQLFAPNVLFNNVSLGNDNNPPPGYGQLFSPNVPPAPFDTDDLFILSCNGQPNSPCQLNPDGPVGCYCSNAASPYAFLGCQQVQFSATPVASYVGPLQTGSKIVTVCGVGNSLDGKSCNTPRTIASVTPPGSTTPTVTRFIYGNGVLATDPGLPLPPGATGGTLSNDFYTGVGTAFGGNFDPATGLCNGCTLPAGANPVARPIC